MHFAEVMSFILVMEKFVTNVRFILIGNYVSSIIPALQSRCTKFRFGPISKTAIENKLKKIVEEEGLRITLDALKTVVDISSSSGDMRRGINILQTACSSISSDDTITEDLIYNITAIPRPDDIGNLAQILINQSLQDSITCKNRNFRPHSVPKRKISSHRRYFKRTLQSCYKFKVV